VTAIVLKVNGERVYESASGAAAYADRRRADKIDGDLKETISKLERRWKNKGLVSEKKRKSNALTVWYELGSELNRIGNQYRIFGTTDEPPFWRALYDIVPKTVQRKRMPKRSKEWRRNHFRLCALMAKRSFTEIKRVGAWSVWRDLFDNAKLFDDPRVFDWVAGKITKVSGGHKSIRPFIHAVRRRIKRLDTTILSDDELKEKLESIQL